MTIDFSSVTGFDWDAGNERKSLDRHQVSQTEAEEVFFNRPILALPDLVHSKSEDRFHMLGVSNQGRRLHITFTMRRNGTLIRVISARDMSQKERVIYEQAG